MQALRAGLRYGLVEMIMNKWLLVDANWVEVLFAITIIVLTIVFALAVW